MNLKTNVVKRPFRVWVFDPKKKENVLAEVLAESQEQAFNLCWERGFRPIPAEDARQDGNGERL